MQKIDSHKVEFADRSNCKSSKSEWSNNMEGQIPKRQKVVKGKLNLNPNNNPNPKLTLNPISEL